jgi:hypothetical protein
MLQMFVLTSALSFSLQQAAAAELNLLGTQWKELSDKNIEIGTACLELKAEIEILRQEALTK